MGVSSGSKRSSRSLLAANSIWSCLIRRAHRDRRQPANPAQCLCQGRSLRLGGAGQPTGESAGRGRAQGYLKLVRVQARGQAAGHDAYGPAQAGARANPAVRHRAASLAWVFARSYSFMQESLRLPNKLSDQAKSRMRLAVTSRRHFYQSEQPLGLITPNFFRFPADHPKVIVHFFLYFL